MIRIPFLNLDPMHKQIKQEMLEAFTEVYDSNWYVMGEKLEAFEHAYASFNNVPHAIGVSNGLDALFLCLKALNIGAGDEVIIPSHTFIATALAVTHTGAKPVLVEPDLATYNIDPARIEEAITPRTKAIIPVHMYGQPCAMDVIMDIANRHGIYVVEDNAQAHGAKFKGRMTGSFGIANATSFYPVKNLGALGDGGMITCNDEAIANRIKRLRNYGSVKKYHHDEPGFNMRLDELQAAFLLIKLKYLEDWNTQRQQIAAWYSDALQGIENIVLPTASSNVNHVFHQYVIRTPKRDSLKQYLEDHGIQTLIHYPVAIHQQAAYKGLIQALPLAETISNQCLSLPIWPGLMKEQCEEIAFVIRRHFT